MNETTTRIRALNDEFRRSMDNTKGRVMLTAGVDALPSDVKAMVIRKVATFDAFTADNDPHGEHDFGSFELAGQKIFWKIDLYEEPEVKGTNEEPLVTRVLTIMLADECAPGKLVRSSEVEDLALPYRAGCG